VRTLAQSIAPGNSLRPPAPGRKTWTPASEALVLPAFQAARTLRRSRREPSSALLLCPFKRTSQSSGAGACVGRRGGARSPASAAPAYPGSRASDSPNPTHPGLVLPSAGDHLRRRARARVATGKRDGPRLAIPLASATSATPPPTTAGPGGRADHVCPGRRGALLAADSGGSRPRWASVAGSRRISCATRTRSSRLARACR